MKRTRTTIKDIASELNVSTSTVSRALSNYPAIKEETRKAVKKLAKKWNYQPNMMALNFMNQTSTTIALIVPDITSYFFSTAVTGIQDVFVSTQYNIIICISNESIKEETLIIKKLSKIQIAGILIAPASTNTNFDHIREFQTTNIPLVVFARDCKGLKVHKVLVDDYSGSFQAVDYLIKSGCKRIAFITGGSNFLSTSWLPGCISALKENNVPVLEELIVHTNGFKHEDGIAPIELLLKSKNIPDAIFAVNDRLAVSAMHIVKKFKFRIPEEISIIGFDDEPHSSYFTPALSSVWQPVYDIGMLAARILLKDIDREEGVDLKLRHEVFKTELIIRKTSKII